MSIPIRTSLNPIPPVYTREMGLCTRDFLGSDPNGITFESDPIWVRIADPNGFGSVESRVNARPIRHSLGTDPFGSDLVDFKDDEKS